LFDYVTEHTIQWEQGLEVVKHLKELNKVEDALIACEEIIRSSLFFFLITFLFLFLLHSFYYNR